jgi:hypothetical protein
MMHSRRLLMLISWSTSVCWAGKYHPAIQYLFPLPGSQLLPTRTTIILRLRPELTIPDDLNGFIRVQTSGTDHTGQILLSPDLETIIYKPETEFQPGQTVSVSIETSRLGTDNYQYEFSTASGSSNVLEKSMPRISEIVAEPMQTDAVPDIRLINGVAVPQDFPTLETIQTGPTAAGKLFFATHFKEPGTGSYVIIATNDGTPAMYRRFDDMGNIANFVLQPGGVFSAYLYGLGHDVILNQSLDIIGHYPAGHGYQCDEHEFLLLENGHALQLSEQHLRIDMSRVVPGGNPNATVQGNMFQEFDTDKNVIFEWRSWDHYRLQDATGISLTDNNIDYVHMNAITPDFDGHYILSSRHLSEATKIDRNTGEIIWRFGGKNNQFTFINEDVDMSWQHHFKPLPGVPGHYTVFDNGNVAHPRFSRAVEYELDTGNMTAEKVWEYRYQPDRYSNMMGSVQRLPNGNTYIDWSTTSPVKSCEVTPDGKVVFELYSAGASTYRSHRYDWQGEFQVPYLVIENYGYVVDLIFNKFDEGRVAYYNIYHRTGFEKFTVFDSTRQTYYRVLGLENDISHSFRVTAVDGEGSESLPSRTIIVPVHYDIPGINLIENGSFESAEFWKILKAGTGNATGQLTVNGYKVHLLNGGDELADVKLVQENLLLVRGNEYTLSFEASADQPRAIQPRIQKATAPYTDYGKIGMLALSRQMKPYSVSFVMENTDYDAMLAFECGEDKISWTLNHVSLIELAETGLRPDRQTQPECTVLLQNFPNPFNPETEIRYRLPDRTDVILTVYDIRGHAVAVLVRSAQDAGNHSVCFNGEALGSGLYFYQLKMEKYSAARRMLLLK